MLDKQDVINGLTLFYAEHLGDTVQVFDDYIYVELDTHYGDVKLRFPYEASQYTSLSILMLDVSVALVKEMVKGYDDPCRI